MNEKILYRLPLVNNNLNYRIEAHKASHLNIYKKYRVILLAFIFLLLITYLINLVCNYNFSINEALFSYFNNVKITILNIAVLICIFRIVEIRCWARWKINHYKNKKISKNYSIFINFYELNYTITFETNLQIYSEYILEYSNISKYLLTDNLIIIYSNPKDSLSPIILNDSLENFESFLGFIDAKIHTSQ